MRQAVAHHAEYWESNPEATPQQLVWCANAFVGQRVSAIAVEMMNELVQDTAIVSSTVGDGSDVSDTALQGAVDKICEKYS